MSSDDIEDNVFYECAEEEYLQTDKVNRSSNITNINYSNKITAENIKIKNSNYSHSPNNYSYDNSNTVNRYTENVSNLTGLYFSPDEEVDRTSRGRYIRKIKKINL